MDILDEATLGGAFFSLLLSIAIFFTAKRAGFFNLPKGSNPHSVSFLQTAGAFFCYLFTSWILVPFFFLFILFVATGTLSTKTPLAASWLVWGQALSFYLLFVLLLLYSQLIQKETRCAIFWPTGQKSVKRFFTACAFGFIACLISYPFVWLMTIIAKAASSYFFGPSETEQVAVEQLKLTEGKPVLFALMTIAIVLLAPIIEELLFRGFLQNLLKRYLGRTTALILTAIIFACAHFARSQGIGNFQLICSLSVLAFFLGFIYERQGTLWAPIALHATFNGFSVLFLSLFD